MSEAAVLEAPEVVEGGDEQVVRPKKGKTKGASDKSVVLVNVSEIKSNLANPRNSLPTLNDMGYGIFTKIADSDKPALVPMGMDKNPEKKAEFCKLIEEFESGIVQLGAAIKINGQINAITLVPAEDGVGYDLETGCRRVLACIYNAAKWGIPAKIRAQVCTSNEKEKQARAFSENFNRLDMSPVEQARFFANMKNMGLNIQDMEERTGVEGQTIRNRLMLLQLEKIQSVRVAVPATDGKMKTVEMTGDKLLEMVQRDEVPEYRAREIIRLSKQPVEPKGGDKVPVAGKGATGQNDRSRVPTLKGWQEMYETRKVSALYTEEVRKFIAKELIDAKYLDFPALREKIEEQAKEEARLKKEKEDQKAAAKAEKEAAKAAKKDEK